MDITIRRATEHDAEVIFSLIKEFALFQGTPERVTITPRQMISEKDIFRCFVAETDTAEIAGFASYFFAYYSWTGKALYLDDLYVKESFRGYKIGTRLLTTIIDLAKQENCKKLRWQVSKWNSDGLNFYKKIGAVID